MNESSDNILKKDFIRQCEDLTADIIDLSIDLNDGRMDINDDINRIIEVIKEMKDYKEKLNISDETKFELNSRFDKVKEDFISLKNKHIAIYNEEVDYVNNKVSVLTMKLDVDGLTQNVKRLIGRLSEVKRCDTYIDGNWDQNVYLNALDYNKLQEVSKIVSEIDEKLKIENDEPLDLFVIANGVNNSINKIKRDMKNELSLSSINTNLDKCITLLERIADLDIKLEFMKEKISKEMFDKYYEKKVLKFRKEVKKIEKELLTRKSGLVKKSNYYVELLNDLEHISNKYDMLNNKILEYEGRCTLKVVNVFNNYLNYLTKNLFEIQDRIKEYDEKGMLNQEQKDNIYNKLILIAEKHKRVNIRSNEVPTLLKQDEEKKFVLEKIVNFDKLLDELENRVSKIEETIKNGDLKNEIDQLVFEGKEKIGGFDGLLKYYKTNEKEKYDKLKLEIDRLKDRYNTVCDMYYSKCSLKVKSVRTIKKVYEEHRKLGLISAGISTLALLSSASSLLPAIMYGNTVVSSNVPALKGMMSLFNKILGGVSGASITNYGVWKLANGAILSASTATTAILKSLATFSVGIASFVSPVIVSFVIKQVKKLNEKIKKYELKNRFVESYEKTLNVTNEKINEVKNNYDSKKEEKKINQYYQDLYDKYCNDSKLSLNDFCQKYELSERDKKILKLMEEEESLKSMRKQQLNEVLEESIGRRK